MLATILQGVGYGFTAALQPGPFQTYVISQTLARGWRRALPIALAPLVSDGPIIALMLLVLSQVPAWLQRALYVASGLFLLYLAYSAFVSWRNFELGSASTDMPGRSDAQSRRDAPPWHSTLKAATMNAISPGPYLFWGLVGAPILLNAWRQAPTLALGFLLGFYVTIVSSLAGIILLFGTARQLGPRVTRALLGISALALLGFGIYQLWLGLGPALRWG
jgi:threonine/homoserine/homoserine lactone efflux protein